MIRMATSMGDIRIELFAEQAPKTVENFLKYMGDGHYNSTIFHRVIPGFMIQGGGFDGNFIELPTMRPIVNEAGNGLSNARGTLAMARTNEINSATCQFFINAADNTFLDHQDDTPDGFGYCVFAQVVEGMEVVDAILEVETGRHGPHEDVPLKPVVIKSVTQE
ncbi:MAG: peptidylprolyl isomerase [Rhodospirillales bacterium]|jgi:peptidyl-prolyl cis-trans isomerase B (cyclophilin B)|nr:peptidylprolyl isomerase [Rhodospirillales bacterium]